jgi:hypothetical protein
MNQGAVIAYLSGIVSYNSKVREVERNLIVHFRPDADIVLIEEEKPVGKNALCRDAPPMSA